MNDDRPVMLVAGGTGAIGGAVAAAAVAAGWRAIVHGRDDARVSATLDALGGAAGDRAGVTLDAFGDHGAEAMVQRAGACFDRIDAVVDCITGGPPGVVGRFVSTDPAGFSGLLDASLGHFQRLAHAALPWLAQRGGTLIAFSSDAGRFAAPNQSVIAASRAGLIGFVRNLALEVSRAAVRVHCICPAYVEGSASLARTEARVPDRIASARSRAGLGLPYAADIAPLVLFLCGGGASRITGQVISVNGGLNA